VASRGPLNFQKSIQPQLQRFNLSHAMVFMKWQEIGQAYSVGKGNFQVVLMIIVFIQPVPVQQK
jgi:hypothetical protein